MKLITHKEHQVIRQSMQSLLCILCAFFEYFAVKKK